MATSSESVWSGRKVRLSKFVMMLTPVRHPQQLPLCVIKSLPATLSLPRLFLFLLLSVSLLVSRSLSLFLSKLLNDKCFLSQRFRCREICQCYTIDLEKKDHLWRASIGAHVGVNGCHMKKYLSEDVQDAVRIETKTF